MQSSLYLQTMKKIDVKSSFVAFAAGVLHF